MYTTKAKSAGGDLSGMNVFLDYFFFFSFAVFLLYYFILLLLFVCLFVFHLINFHLNFLPCYIEKESKCYLAS